MRSKTDGSRLISHTDIKIKVKLKKLTQKRMSRKKHPSICLQIRCQATGLQPYQVLRSGPIQSKPL